MKFLFSLFFVCLSLMSFSQMSTVVLKNPSFEDTPRKGGQINAIKGWYDCGIINFPGESAPDIHPMGFWNVDSDPYEGKTYLGLVVRDNQSWESVSQKLTTEDGTVTPLLIGNCYVLSMAVSRSDKYMSGSRYNLANKNDKSQTYNYNTPVVIRIWGGNSFCGNKELLAESKPVVNAKWERVDLNFKPKADYKFITIEAFYDVPVLVPYNGHVLIDNLSDIIQVECKG